MHQKRDGLDCRTDSTTVLLYSGLLSQNSKRELKKERLTYIAIYPLFQHSMMILSRAALSTIFGHLFLLSAVQGAKPTPPTAPTPTPPTSSCAAATKTCGANKPCNNGACCSQWGYCGTGDAYCGACCQSGCPSTPTTPTVTSPPTNQPTPNNPTPTNNPPSTCPAVSAACGPGNPCSGGLCCSQWGYCGDTEAYCGTCCQSNCWGSPTSPITTTTTSTSSASPPTGSPPSTASNEDSRLIAYLGNWQDCPSSTQVAAYTHIVIAFAVSYTWAPGKNICDSQCNVGSTLPTCGNLYRPDLINEWRNMGKKVILSFGGAGMGGSWSGDSNNCWDYCFGKEDALSTSLVDLVKSHDLDGVDIDYEYCYDVNGLQSGRCSQRSSLYTDAKAQTFLNSLTSKLRIKLDALQTLNGYNRGRYEVTHAPMDVDVSRTDSKYYGILKARHADLDFLMPQFYNGVTRPAVDGVTGTGAGSLSAVSIFNILANDMFQAEPQKVVFGFCISDCGGTGSNVNANQAALVLTDLKAYNQGVFGCNGGAFFWVAQHDIGGTWSSTVMAEVGKTAGCSATMTTTSTAVTSTTSTTSSSTTTSKPTNAPTSLSPTAKPVSSTTSTTSTMTTATSKPTNAPTSRSPTAKPITKAPVTLAPVSAPPSTSPPSTSKPTSSGTGELVISTSPRCGISEIDARERCQQECTSSADCPSGQWCWGTHPNLCGSIKQRVYTNPVQSTVWTRCGTDEIFARTFCTQECTWQGQCPSGQDCIALNPNYCGSPYYEV